MRNLGGYRGAMKKLVPIIVTVVLVCAGAAAFAVQRRGSDEPAAARISSAGLPALRVRRLASGLDHPWDVKSIGDGRFLVTQRERASLSLVTHGRVRTIGFPSAKVWVSGETGLMGLEVDPSFAKNRRIYTCQGGYTADGGHDVHVMSWKLSRSLRRVTSGHELVGGFPTSTGRHGGCRLLVAKDGSLYVGTGDAAQGTNPEDVTSLGGKVLRLDRFSGAPWPTNPFIGAANINQRYVESYGHRNVQGLAQRSDGRIFSVEHGTFRDDEVNLLVDGGDYGYNPVPGYNEEVPMTDQSLPGTQIEAAWSSGDPTVAPGGATFIRGKQWGGQRGVLAMAVLKDEEVLFLTFDEAGALTKVRAPDELSTLGRVRTVVSGPRGDLLVTTDNGDGKDALYRVRPR